MTRQLLVLLLAVSPAWAQPAVGWPKEGEPAFSVEQAHAWRDAMKPLVEQAAGRDFKSVPDVRVVTREELHESVLDDAMIARRGLTGSDDDEMTRMLVELDVIAIAPSLLGRYSLSRKTIDLAAGNATPLFEAAGIEPSELEPIMKLVVAHELAHALHAQHLPLVEQVGQVRTRHELQALQATMEGFAMLVQERVAEKADATDANQRLIDFLSAAWAEGTFAQAARDRYRLLYGAGLEFARAHADRIWDVLAKPPVTYAQVRDPSTFGDTVEMEFDLPRFFRGCDSMLDAAGWTSQVSTADGASLSRGSQALGPEAVALVREAVKQAHMLQLAKRAAIPTVRNLAAMELSGADRGAQLMNQFKELAETRSSAVRTAAETQGVTIETEMLDEIAGLDVDDAHLARIGAAGASPELVIAAARQSDRLVRLIASGGLSNEAVRDTFDTMLARLADTSGSMVPVEPPDRSDPLVRAIEGVRAELGEGWVEEIREVPESGLTRLMPNDVEGGIALSMGFRRAQGAFMQHGRERKALALFVVELNQPELADKAGEAMKRHLALPMQMLRQAPGMVVGEVVAAERTVAGDIAVVSRQASVTQHGKPSSIAVLLASRGRFLVHLMDMDTGLSTEAVDELLTTLFGGLSE